MHREQLDIILADLHRRLELHYGDRLAHVILFGSQARREASPESDIDVLVVLEGEVDAAAEIERTIHDIVDLCSTHDVLLACVFTSRDEYEHWRSPFLLNIHREGVLV